MADRFIILYETPAEHGWKAHHTAQKAVMLWANPDDAALPYGFWADYIGPDEDVVCAITAIVPVHIDDDDPTIIIDNKRYRFTDNGAPELMDE